MLHHVNYKKYKNFEMNFTRFVGRAAKRICHLWV